MEVRKLGIGRQKLEPECECVQSGKKVCERPLWSGSALKPSVSSVKWARVWHISGSGGDLLTWGWTGASSCSREDLINFITT